MAPTNSLRTQFRIRAASQIEQRELAWLWRGWLPHGKLALLDGDPGLGKSLQGE
jgi:putative DNA primase/helicase